MPKIHAQPTEIDVSLSLSHHHPPVCQWGEVCRCGVRVRGCVCVGGRTLLFRAQSSVVACHGGGVRCGTAWRGRSLLHARAGLTLPSTTTTRQRPPESGERNAKSAMLCLCPKYCVCVGCGDWMDIGMPAMLLAHSEEMDGKQVMSWHGIPLLHSPCMEDQDSVLVLFVPSR